MRFFSSTPLDRGLEGGWDVSETRGKKERQVVISKNV
jgi:hypothetical protein